MPFLVVPVLKVIAPVSPAAVSEFAELMVMAPLVVLTEAPLVTMTSPPVARAAL